MKATTVKIDGKLLKEIEAAKAPTETVTSFVRTVLQRSIQAERSRRAAEEYRNFVTSDEQERRWLEEWDAADLISSPTQKNGNEG